MKYELSIDASYLDDDRWGVAAGLREFLQNGRDAEIEQNAPLTVTHNARSNKLIIENEGAVLTRDALLLGRSSKRDRQDVLAGKWGEGLKLGALALVRSGRTVTIRNGGEVWTPAIEKSEKFAGRDVLVFDVATGRQEQNRVRVEISDISVADWNILQDCFMFLQRDRDAAAVVKVEAGALLLDPKLKGAVFVKGIKVQQNVQLAYGYDLTTASIDRDRRVIDQWDLNARIRDIWFAACVARADLISKFADMLDTGAADIEGIERWNTYAIPDAARAAVVERFKERHGAAAVPVGTLADSMDIEHFGKVGVVVRKQLQAVLESVTGTLDTVKEQLASEATRIYSWHEFDAAERANLTSALALVTQAGGEVSVDDLTIADFRSPTLQGQFNPNTGNVVLAKKLLQDPKELLVTLVHEVAHRAGGDGDHGHIAALEKLWGNIVADLRGKLAAR